MKTSWFVYILECQDGSFYVGQTHDPILRFQQHKLGIRSRYAHSRIPIRIVYLEEYSTALQALKREAQIKGWSRAKKLKLIRGEWGPENG